MSTVKYQHSEYADHTHKLFSEHLQKSKTIHIFLPHDYDPNSQLGYGTMYLNDGQDVEALQLRHRLNVLYGEGKMLPVIVVAIRAGARLREYGTAGIPDYANRGDQAEAYSKFVVDELMPFIKNEYRVDPNPALTFIIGFSLGGLSAFDITWNYPHIFGRVGVFSGSLWWRRQSENDHVADIDRIVHDIVRQGHKREGLKFWFEAGTEDEEEDRNNNGIIDAIDDTLDLMNELVNTGYDREHDIRYVEVQGGQHNHYTWSEVLPDFMLWAYGK